MSDATAKVFEALRSIDVPEDKAIAAAAALGQRAGEVLTRAELRAELAPFVTKAELRAELSELKHELLRWVVGLFVGQTIFLIGLVITLFRLLPK